MRSTGPIMTQTTTPLSSTMGMMVGTMMIVAGTTRMITTKSASINNFLVSRCLRYEGVIPFAMERISLEIQASQFLIADLAAFFIAFVVESGRDSQAGFRFRVPDEVDDGHTVEQWPATPILGNEAEHAVLDLIPLACARRKMRDVNRQVEGIGKPVQFGFPQAHATTVTASPISRDIELRGFFV